MDQTTKAMAEKSMMTFARGWWREMGLEMYGVPLGDALEYDVLRVVGAVWKQYLDEQRPAAGEQAAQS